MLTELRLRCVGEKEKNRFFTLLSGGSPQLPSEYEANPELLFYRITHLNHRQQYLIWAAAVTTAGKGNFSDKVTVEPAAKGESSSMKGNLHIQRIGLCLIKHLAGQICRTDYLEPRNVDRRAKSEEGSRRAN